MPEWNDLKSALKDYNFHDLSLDAKRSEFRKYPDYQDMLDEDIDKVLGKAWNKYYVPKEKRQPEVKLPKIDIPTQDQELPKPTELQVDKPIYVAPKSPDIKPPAATLKELYQNPAFHRQSVEEKRRQSSLVDSRFGELDSAGQDQVLSKAWNKYAKQLPAPPSTQFAQTQAPPDESSIPHEFWEGMKQGTQQSIQAGGGLLQWVGHLAGVDTVNEWGKDIEDWGTKSIQVDLPPEEVAGSLLDKPWLLTSPRWWSRGAGSIIPYATIFATMAAGSTAIATAALPATATAGTIAATAAGINAVINSVFIGASQYVDEKQAGRTDEEASKSAAWASTVDLPWTFITTRMGIFGNKEASGFLKNAFKSMVSEGVQEGGEQVIQNASSKFTGGKKELSEGVLEATIQGGVMGPVIGKAVDMVMPRSSNTETLKTQDVQVRAALRKKRWGVIFTDPNITPESIKGLSRFDYVMKNVNDETGEVTEDPAVFFYNPDMITPDDIKQSIDTNNLGRLGYVEPKSKDTTHVVSVVTKNGDEVISAAVSEPNIPKQKELFQEAFPENDEELKDSVIISGPAEEILPHIEGQRNNPSVDNIIATKDKIDSIISGKTEAPAGVTIEKNSPAPPIVVATELEAPAFVPEVIEEPIQKTDTDLPVGEKNKVSPEVTKENATQPETAADEINRLKEENAKIKADIASAKSKKKAVKEVVKPVSEAPSLPPPPPATEIADKSKADLEEQYRQALEDNARLKAQQVAKEQIQDQEEEAQAPPPTLEAPPPTPTIIQDAEAALREQYEKALAENKALKEEKSEAVESKTTKTGQKTQEIIDREIKFLDAMPVGSIAKLKDGTELFRVQKGWKKHDKHGKQSGATIHTKTLVTKYEFDSDVYNHLLEVGKRFARLPMNQIATGELAPAIAAETPKPRRGRPVMPEIIEVGADQVANELEDPNASPLDKITLIEDIADGTVHVQSEFDEDPFQVTPLEQAPADPNFKPPTPISEVATVPTKTVKGWKKKKKIAPPPITPPLNILPPEQVVTAVPLQAQTVDQPHPQALTEDDYKQSVSSIQAAFEQLADLESEMIRRRGEDQTGLFKGESNRRGQFGAVPSQDLSAVKLRLLKAIDKLDHTIKLYEESHPETSPFQAPAAAVQESAQPEVVINDNSPGRLLAGEERKSISEKLKAGPLAEQAVGTTLMGELSSGRQMSTGEFLVDGRTFRVDFTHDRDNPKGNQSIRYIYEVGKNGLQPPPSEGFTQQVVNEPAQEIRDNMQKDLQNLVEEYHASGDMVSKVTLINRIIDESNQAGSGKARLENFILSLEESVDTPEKLQALESELEQILGPVESVESIMDKMQEQASDPDIKPQMMFQFGGKAQTHPQQVVGGREFGVVDPKTNKLLGMRAITIKLARSLDIPVRFKIKDKHVNNDTGIAGLFHPLHETIHLNIDKVSKHNKKLLDPAARQSEIFVMAHEVGHYIDLVLLKDGKAKNINGTVVLPAAAEAEINALGGRSLQQSGQDLALVPPETIRAEGIAEFVRLYLTESRTQLQQTAGNFFKILEGELSKYPAINDSLEEATNDIRNYNTSDNTARLGARIMYADEMDEMHKPSNKDRLSYAFLAMRKMFETRLIGIHESIDRMIKLDPGQEEKYQHLHRLYFNERGKVEEQTMYSIVKQMIDLEGNPIPGVKPLVQILKQVDNMKEFDKYLLAINLRDVERQRISKANKKLPLKDTGVPVEEYMSEIARGQAKYGQLADELGKWANAHLHLLVDAGNISQKSYNKITASRLTYAPLWRVVETMGKVKSSRGGGTGFVNLKVGPQYTKGGGGDAAFHSPIESLVKNMILYRTLARKNYIQDKFFRATDDLQGGGRIAEQWKGDIKITKIPDSMIAEKLESFNIDADVLREEAAEQMSAETGKDVDPDTIDFGIQLYKTLNNANPADMTVVHLRKGEPILYKLEDPELYNALTISDSRLNAFDKNILGKIMRKQAEILRAGAIYDVRFALRNIIRDPFTAFINSHYGFNPYDWGKGMIQTILGDAAVDEYHRHAAGMADQMGQDMNQLEKTIEHTLNLDKSLMEKFGAKWAKADTYAKKTALAWDITGGGAIHMMQKLGQVFEEATRVGLYNKTLKVLTNGNPGSATQEQIEIAIKEAKDTTLPYHRSGTVGGWLNKYIPFTNANLQDLSKFAREHSWEHINTFSRKDGRWFTNNTILKGIMYNMPMAIMTWMLGKDDDKIQNLPTWRQAGFWNINLKGVTDNDFILSIPKPFLLGQIYGSSVETALRWAYKKDPNAVEKWAKSVAQQVLPNVIPTGPLPLVENFVNYNVFRGAPIENQSLEQLLPEYRANPNTSAVAQAIAHGTQWTGQIANSPVKIDNILRGWTGSLGMATVGGAGLVMSAFSADDIPLPSKEVSEYFPINSLTISPYTPSDYMRRFYDASKKADELVKTFRSFEKATEFGEMDKFLTENEESLGWYLSDQATGRIGAATHIVRAKETLGQISKEMLVIKNSPGMKSEDKTKELLELAKLRDDLAKEYFESLFMEEDQKSVF
jgi:hypothetical protein